MNHVLPCHSDYVAFITLGFHAFALAAWSRLFQGMGQLAGCWHGVITAAPSATPLGLKAVRVLHGRQVLGG